MTPTVYYNEYEELIKMMISEVIENEFISLFNELKIYDRFLYNFVLDKSISSDEELARSLDHFKKFRFFNNNIDKSILWNRLIDRSFSWAWTREGASFWDGIADDYKVVKAQPYWVRK